MVKDPVTLFMIAGLLQTLGDKGLLDPADYRSTCRTMLNSMKADMPQQIYKGIDEAIHHMAMFPWAPKVVS